MPPINLLPPEIRTRQRTRRLLSFAIAGAAGVLFLLLIVTLIQRGTINREEDELAQRRARQGRLAMEAAGLRQFGDLEATVQQRRRTLAVALNGDIAWSKFLNDLSLTIPDNAWLVNLALASAPGQAQTAVPSFGTVTFTGNTMDFPALAGYLTRIAQIDGLTFVYLTNGTKAKIGTRDIVSFGSTANITSSLLSQRCQGTGPCP
ncbi:MAG TPA: PilN domain-containing protein [Actinomycetota bacterium]|nr:PilN domain-containing protein [Actinomycetota bacterium]